MAEEQPRTGAIVHVEFAVKEPKKVKDFYGKLFGWKFEEIPQFDYTTFQPASGPGGGIGPLQPGQQPGITNYLLVPSVDEYVKKVEKAGGKILVAKREVPGQGWFAMFTDPAGTHMALWQPDHAHPHETGTK